MQPQPCWQGNKSTGHCSSRFPNSNGHEIADGHLALNAPPFDKLAFIALFTQTDTTSTGEALRRSFASHMTKSRT
jgi:hypothetical protein